MIRQSVFSMSLPAAKTAPPKHIASATNMTIASEINRFFMIQPSFVPAPTGTNRMADTCDMVTAH